MILQINADSPDAMKFIEFARTLPFVAVDKSKWQQALDEGACPVDEFFDELDRRIEKRFENA
jgi:hypothetical protein